MRVTCSWISTPRCSPPPSAATQSGAERPLAGLRGWLAEAPGHHAARLRHRDVQPRGDGTHAADRPQRAPRISGRGGTSTRDIVGGFKAQDWDGQVSAEGMQAAAAAGAYGVRTEGLLKAFTGRPRAAVLSGLAIFHPAAHMGEAATVRTAGGFGTGV